MIVKGKVLILTGVGPGMGRRLGGSVLPIATSSRGSGPRARVSGYKNLAARSAVRSVRGPTRPSWGRTPVSA